MPSLHATVSGPGARPVPISMGSSWSTCCQTDRFIVTHATFPAGMLLESHVHERPTFAMILQGGFELSFTSPALRRRNIHCTPGTIFTEPAGERHTNLMTAVGASVIVLSPDPAAPALHSAMRTLLDGIEHFTHPGIARLGRSLAREVHAHDGVTPLAIEALALEMIVTATRRQRAERTSAVQVGWMQRALDFVHAHFRESLRIHQVAMAAGVHPAHLAASFRRMNGVPLGTYIRQLRLEWAAEQLARTHEPISAIALRSGFADQAHLTRALKQSTGLTPARYRTEWQSTTADPRGRMLRAI